MAQEDDFLASKYVEYRKAFNETKASYAGDWVTTVC